MSIFVLENQDYIPLNNLLKASGLCSSGGLAKRLIDDGLVAVDGQPETRKRCKVRAGQVVSFDGQDIHIQQG
ncbi:MAG: RNA-binding protein [Desulfuromonas sp.]|nr:MAG: RNA-binding protein [Desulfuromonas sp.]